MSRLLVWGAGYSPEASAGASTGDLEHLGKLGGVVWFVAVWTAITWMIASTSFMTWAPSDQRAALAAGFGLAGLGFVLLFDRTMMFFLDTRLERRFALLWLAFRITVILAVGTITTERILPIFLRAELQHQALIERETSEASRQASLSSRFQLPVLTTRAEAARQEVVRVESESRAVPESIRASLNRARLCRESVAVERRRLLRQGLARQRVASMLAGRNAVCRRAGREAQAALAEHRREMAEQLREARARSARAGAAHESAATSIEQRLAAASAVEGRSIVPESSIVLGRLVRASPASAATAAVLMTLMLAVELLPFILKGFAGRTALGTRLAAQRSIDALEPTVRLRCKEDEAAVAVNSSQAVTAAILEALQSESLQVFMRELAEAEARQLAPLDAMLWTLQAIERKKREADSLAVRTPELASLVYAMWTQAIRDLDGRPQPFAT